jgi:hypothetical protein
MKKLLTVAVAAVAGAAGLVAWRRTQSQHAEADLWGEATDPVAPIA